MLKGNKSGLRGCHPMISRKFGLCCGFGEAGFGRGFGCWECSFCPWLGKQDKKMVKKHSEAYIKNLEEELKEAKKMLGKLDKKK
jgi:hypothetical protein